MKAKFGNLLGTLFVLTALSASCLAQESQPAASSSALDVANQLIVAMNEGDFEAARALFAEDGYSAYGMDGNPHVGEGLDAWLESDIFSLNAQFEVANETVCEDGNTAVLDGRWGANGDLTRDFRYVFAIQNELIQSWNIIEPEGENPCEGI